MKTRYELIDYDYINKLSEEEKDWLNRFTEEFVGANFNHSGEILHDSKELKRDCYGKNNARNRDILTKMKASGKIEYIEELYELVYNKEELGDEILDIVEDLKDSNNKSSE